MTNPIQELKSLEDILAYVEQSKKNIGMIYYAISRDDPNINVYK
jgi:hypothetical protein